MMTQNKFTLLLSQYWGPFRADQSPLDKRAHICNRFRRWSVAHYTSCTAAPKTSFANPHNLSTKWKRGNGAVDEWTRSKGQIESVCVHLCRVIEVWSASINRARSAHRLNCSKESWVEWWSVCSSDELTLNSFLFH